MGKWVVGSLQLRIHPPHFSKITASNITASRCHRAFDIKRDSEAFLPGLTYSKCQIQLKIASTIYGIIL